MFYFKCNLSEATPIELLGVKFAICNNNVSKNKKKKKSSLGISAPLSVSQEDLEKLSKGNLIENEKNKNVEKHCMHMCVKGEQTVPANTIKNRSMQIVFP